nr:katanin p80 WD40 repeat-containing subunit B1 homolog isoform X1 [Tanacetum cinerariifolium]
MIIKQGLKELRILGIQHRLLEESRQSVNGYTSPIKSIAFDLIEVLVAAGASSGLIQLWDLDETNGIAMEMMKQGATTTVPSSLLSALVLPARLLTLTNIIDNIQG